MLWYEWDDAKSLANQAKHGVAFEEILAFRWDTVLESPDRRNEFGEIRWIALGFIGARLHVAIYTMRESACRLISLRKANLRERRAYEEKKKQA